jgi:ribosomal-protein-alanine N-acetyltransferase
MIMMRVGNTMFIQPTSQTAAATPEGRLYPVLHTPHLNLRQLTSADRECIYELFCQPEVTLFNPLPMPNHLREIDARIAQWRDEFLRGTSMHWAITLGHSQDHVIGLCGFEELDIEGRVGRVQYYLHPMYWRHGLMTQALEAVVRYGFNTLGLNRIDNWISLENFAAAGLMETLGFHSEQIIRQHSYWKYELHDMELYARYRR